MRLVPPFIWKCRNISLCREPRNKKETLAVGITRGTNLSAFLPYSSEVPQEPSQDSPCPSRIFNGRESKELTSPIPLATYKPTNWTREQFYSVFCQDPDPGSNLPATAFESAESKGNLRRSSRISKPTNRYKPPTPR